VGIAVPTTVASSAAINIPVITPAVTAQRRRADISKIGFVMFPVFNSEACSTLVRSSRLLKSFQL
jgi:hypothetical protein